MRHRPTIWTLSAVLAAGCGGDDGPPPDAPISADCVEAQRHSDLAWIQDRVFAGSCTFSSCHDANLPAAGMDLSPGTARSELVGVAATEPGAGAMLVAPRAPDQSYLLVALGGAAGTPPSDGRMPLGGARLCQEKLDAIRRWIAAGAPP